MNPHTSGPNPVPNKAALEKHAMGVLRFCAGKISATIPPTIVENVEPPMPAQNLAMSILHIILSAFLRSIEDGECKITPEKTDKQHNIIDKR